MTRPPLLAVPNFSEGRCYHFYRTMKALIAQHKVYLHSIGWDVDHNRTVVAISGDPEPLQNCLQSLAVFALQLIDMRRHRGVHPRIGAMDVVPVIPTEPQHEEMAQEFVLTLAEFIGMLPIPVFLYGRSARPGRISELPALRKGQFEGWADKELTGDHAPDFGMQFLHPSAGACIIGVRGPLIAFNVNLWDPDPALAKEIAAAIRAERTNKPKLPGVQSMGVPLESRGMSQVSTNITEPDRVGIADVFAFVRGHALEKTAWSELIGVIRRSDLARAEALPIFEGMELRYYAEQVLDY
jgi:glutamate formiminotransferase